MATLIRLKQIESGSALETSAQVGSNFSGAVFEIIDGAGLFSSSQQVDLVAASNYDGFVVQLDMTMSSDLEASIISSSISQSISILSTTYVTTASLQSLSSSIALTDSSSQHLIQILSSSVQATSGEFSASVANTFATQSLNITSVSSSLSEFTSSIGLTIKQKLNTENVITSSRQLDGSLINNLTLGTTGDAYSLIVSGALAVVDADILISGSEYNVAGEIWINGQTGSAGNPPVNPYDNSGNPQSNIIDQGEW